MTTNLQMWKPPERKEVDLANQYQASVAQQNDIALTDLIAEHRDVVMRKQLDVSGKFMDKIAEHVELIDEIGSKKEQRTTLRSLAETMKVVSDVQAKAAMFDHVAKPKAQEEGTTRVSLFVNCAPVGVARHGAIDVEAREA